MGGPGTLRSGGPAPSPVRVLTVRQPWASLIVLGVKPVENRAWRPPGALVGSQLAIHAAREPAPLGHWSAAGALVGDELMQGEFPCGALVGVVILTGYYSATVCRSPDGGHCSPWAAAEAGVIHWRFTGARALWTPVPCLGALGVWTLPDHLSERLRRALELARAREVASDE